MSFITRMKTFIKAKLKKPEMIHIIYGFEFILMSIIYNILFHIHILTRMKTFIKVKLNKAVMIHIIYGFEYIPIQSII